MMRNEQRKDAVSPIVVDSNGVFVTDAPNGFENVRAVLTEYVHRAEKKQQDMTEHEKYKTARTISSQSGGCFIPQECESYRLSVSTHADKSALLE